MSRVGKPGLVLSAPGLLCAPGAQVETGANAGGGPALEEPLRALALALSRADAIPRAAGAAPAVSAAALSRAGEGTPGDPVSGYLAREEIERWHWLRADPVHLRPDLAGMSMLPAHALDLSADEAASAVGTLNELFPDGGLRFEAPAPSRWYLRQREPLGIVTTPPDEARAQSLSRSLPRGERSGFWHRVLNETQMALHAAPCNRERVARRLPAVNGVWLWGEAKVARDDVSDCSGVYTNDPIVRGLARLANAAAHALPPGLAAMPADARGRIRVHADPAGSPEALAALCRDWLVPGLEKLRAGELRSLEIVTGDGRAFALRRAGIRRFWRRRRALEHWLRDPVEGSGR